MINEVSYMYDDYSYDLEFGFNTTTNEQLVNFVIGMSALSKNDRNLLSYRFINHFNCVSHNLQSISVSESQIVLYPRRFFFMFYNIEKLL